MAFEYNGQPAQSGLSDPSPCMWAIQASPTAFPGGPVVLYASEESTITCKPVGQTATVTITFTGLLPCFVEKVTAVTGTVFALADHYHTYA